MREIAIAAPMLWLAWLVLTEWVPMFPLNDLRTDNVRLRLLAAAINYPIPLLIAGGVTLGRTWSTVAALVLCLLTLVGHLANWWVPYFGRALASQRDMYQRDYARTLKVLPTKGRQVVPDVQHMVVGALTLLMLATTGWVTIGG